MTRIECFRRLLIPSTSSIVNIKRLAFIPLSRQLDHR